MGRTTCAALAGLACSGAVGAQTSSPFDNPRALETGTIPSVLTEWLGAYDGYSTDATRWSHGAGLGPESVPWPRVRVRAVGAPYTIEIPVGTFAASFETRSPGATIRLPSVTLHAVAWIRLSGPLVVPAGAEGSQAYLRSRETELRGPVILDQATAFRTAAFGGSSVDVLVGDSFLLRAPALSSAQGGFSMSVSGMLRNEGVIELSGRVAGRAVTLEVREEFTNVGTLRSSRGQGDGPRLLTGSLMNTGRMEIDADTTLRPVNFFDDAFAVNDGELLVSDAGSLLVETYEKFEHRGGLIDAQGPMVFDHVAFEMTGGVVRGSIEVISAAVDLSGGVFEGALTVRGSFDGTNGSFPLGGVTVIDGSLALPEEASGAVSLIGAGPLSGPIGPGCDMTIEPISASTPTLWTGSGDIDGVLRIRGGRVEWSEQRTNSGIIDIESGRADGPLDGDGDLRLRFNTRMGSSQALEFGGLIDVDASALATIAAPSILVRGSVRVRPTAPTFNPIGGYQVLMIGHTTLDGATLEIEPGVGFNPAWGRPFNLIGATTVTGQFASVTAPPLPDPNWFWEIERSGASFRGRIHHRADVNRDLVIDFSDLDAVVAAWHTSTSGPEDVNGDGFVDFADLAIVAAHVGQSAG